MRSFDGCTGLSGTKRFAPLPRRIKLLNRGWHSRAVAERIGLCANCEQEIKADQRAVHLHGELYHAGCASLVGRPERL